jgi:pimeloyl-ACP methyl ester carboxylesterase
MKTLKLPMLMLAALLGTSALAQQGPTPEQMRAAMLPYATAPDAVNLPDGRQLAFVCMGEGSPTVILTAGGGNTAFSSWSLVQPAMAETTRVCAWDRPGWGLSDGSPAAQNSGTTTADLEAALASGKIPWALRARRVVARLVREPAFRRSSPRPGRRYGARRSQHS